MKEHNVKRSQEEIDAEIAKLEELKDKVPGKSMFGDDNQAAVRAEIDVLKEKRSRSDIYKKYGGDIYVCDSALTAWGWMTGDVEQPTSVDWAELVG